MKTVLQPSHGIDNCHLQQVLWSTLEPFYFSNCCAISRLTASWTNLVCCKSSPSISSTFYRNFSSITQNAKLYRRFILTSRPAVLTPRRATSRAGRPHEGVGADSQDSSVTLTPLITWAMNRWKLHLTFDFAIYKPHMHTQPAHTSLNASWQASSNNRDESFSVNATSQCSAIECLGHDLHGGASWLKCETCAGLFSGLLE